MSPKIIFIGTPEFGAIILEGLIKSGFKPFLVITSPDKPVGRKKIITPPPVKIIAQKYNIPIAQPEKVSDYKNEIEKLKPDLIVLASYGQIIPKEIIDVPKYGSINVHPSLLPKYRGASPIQYAILNGDEKTGVTIMRMSEKLDAGLIITNSEFQIPNSKITYPELHNKLAEIGAKLLIETLPKLFSGQISPKEQDDSKATYTKIFKKEDGKIDWQKPAIEIERQVRALNPWPGTFTFRNGKILKILEVNFLNYNGKEQSGQIFLFEKQLAVRSGQNSLILRKLQLEGGKPLLAEDFLRGHREISGKILK